MPRPKEFYFTETTSNVSYSDTPIGTLDVGRFIDGQPCWVASSLPRELKQKKLILADWREFSWPSLDKQQRVRDTLAQLMNEGFSIYFWRNRTVTALTPNSIDNYIDYISSSEKITLAYSDEIVQDAVTQKNFTYDQVFVLDDYWLRQANEDYIDRDQRALILSDLPMIYNTGTTEQEQKKEISKIIDVLRKSTPKVTRIIQDVYESNINETATVAYLREAFPELPVVTQYQNVSLFSRDAKMLADTGRCDDLMLGDLRSVKKMYLDTDNITSSSVQKILDAVPVLEELTLSLYFFEHLSLSPGCLGRLKRLFIRGGRNLTKDTLQNLLCAAPQLVEIIDFRFSYQDYGDLDLAPGSLLYLIDIDLRDLRIKSANVQRLLLAAPNIRSLDLQGYTTFTDDFHLAPESLKSLKNLCLNNSTVNGHHLQHLLAATPNLQKLDLSMCKSLTESFSLEGVSRLLHLEKITLTSSSISYVNLLELLKVAPNVKSLDITECSGPFINTSIEPAFVHLEKLILSECSITDECLHAILSHTPNMKKLDLNGCDQLSGNILLPAKSLPQLEVLSLSGSSIKESSLKSLLEATPKLKTLYLYGCANITLTGVTLSKIETLHLGGLSQRADIQSIVTEAPKLKVLDLSYCIFPEGGLSIKENSLPSLETLCLGRSTITAADLKKILAAAPNLKKIDLQGAPSLGNSSVFDEDLISQLSHIKDVLLPEYRAPNPLDVLKNLKPPRKGFAHDGSSSQPTDHSIETENSQADFVSIDPIHNPTNTKQKKTTPDDAVFKFRGLNHNKNQGMIIERLSQYLTLTKTHLAVIPKLQDGICNALSHYFINCSTKDWDKFMNSVSQWNGVEDTLSAELKSTFSRLYEYVYTYQGKVAEYHLISAAVYYFIRTYFFGYKTQYLGENINLFLATCTTPCVLSNPWHAIAIRPKGNGMWDVYDPNFVNGHREVAAEALQQTIHDAIGHLLSVEATNLKLAPKITHSESFIEMGGLLELCQSVNPKAILAQLDKDGNYSKAALDGILFRDNNGIPAWVRGIKNETLCAYTQTLLQQFIRKNPSDYRAQLERSIECLSPQQKQEIITKLIQKIPTSSVELVQAMRKTLVEAIRPLPDATQDYERFFATWSNTVSVIKTLPEYCMRCMERGEIKKRLIKLSSTAEVNALQLALQKHAQETQRAVFYINSPEDLVCSAAYVARQKDDTGLLKKGPGGPLVDFLRSSKEGHAPILIVNYENFHVDDIVRFNSLLDKERRADLTPLPEDAIVIGLININKPECYQGSDFYSRFDRVETAPLSRDSLVLPVLPFLVNPAVSNNVINLYHAPDWKWRLLGRWVLNGDTLTFEEGALSKAIAKGGPIEIKNGLWEDKAFEQFFRQFILTQQPNLQLIRSEGYSWNNLKAPLEIKRGLVTNAVVLNPRRLSEFFNHYKCLANKLVSQAGVIETAAQQTLTVNLTRALSEDEWAMVLAACHEHGLPKLVVYCAPEVELPTVLQPALSEEPPLSIADNPATKIIISTDIDTTVEQLIAAEGPWKVIDVSECNASDLLGRIDGQLIDGDVPRFYFEETVSVLKKSLADGEKIILKGRFSKELADELAPFLLERQAAQVAGALVLVSDNKAPFNYFPCKVHTVETREKEACLGVLSATVEEYLATEPLSQLKARAQFIQNHADGTLSEESWAGLSDIPYIIPPIEPLNPETSVLQTQAFTSARRAAVNNELGYAPYVFLTGFSGVGKTTFVAEELLQGDDVLYVGEKNRLDWATSTSAGRKLLFIDEANLSPKEWSEFEGLFHNPPTILVRGVLYPLTPEHKVVFAGNPISYSDERKLAPLFQRHGHAVVFSPLPTAFVYEKTLKPIFANTLLAESAVIISDPILKIYGFLCACSTKDVLVSPRELQMIALLVITYHQQNPSVDPLEITRHVAYQLTAHLVPADKRAEFDRVYKPKGKLLRDKAPEMAGFMMTPSRESIRNQLDDWLALRKHRREHQATLSSAQQYGGLGGLVIEGDPGIGKSELVTETLVAQGYKKNYDFYCMPVSMPLNEKEALLRKAFDEGAVVIIDEINSSPMMERLLNALLMGKTPENKAPMNPGFMVIGTQNPVTMAGRRAPSTALARRLTTVELPPYSLDEIRTILIARGMRAHESLVMAQAFIKQVNYAKQNHLIPAPTFRDLLRRADAVLEAHVLASKKIEKIPTNLSEKKQACSALLQNINTSRFDMDDQQMDLFLQQNQEEIDKATDATIDALTVKLSGIKCQLCAEEPTQLEEIKAVIAGFEKNAHGFFSIGMQRKANTIKAAMKRTPIDERLDVFNGASEGAQAAREALAAHRYLLGYVFKQGNTIDEAMAAKTYTEIRNKFSKGK